MLGSRPTGRGGVRACMILLLVCAFAGTCPRILSAEDSLIAQIIEKQRRIRTISADFTQEKHSAMLIRPLVSEGHFRFRAPDKVAWIYTGEIQMVSDGMNLTIFYPELGEAEVIPVKNSLIRLPLSFNLEEFRKHFTLIASEEEGIYKVVLTPVGDATVFSEMVIRLTREGAPSSAEILEKIGDRSIIRFRNQQINKKLPDGYFTIDLPAGTVIRRRGAQ